jgi:hypothetical protein
MAGPGLGKPMVRGVNGRAAKGRNHKVAHANLPPGAIILDIKKYGGRWIATRHGVVMAVADSYKQLDERVVAMGIENDVIFTQVPRSGALVY